MNDKSKNAKRLNFHKGRQPRNPSQTNGTTNVRINSEIAIPKLQELAHRYIGIIDAKGFLDDLRIALGIPNAKRVSKYGEIVVPKDDGSILKASLRITNHQANAGQHIKNNANYDYNLSIVVRRRARKNTFIPHNDVKLDEYVYYGKNISKVENPLTQIINSIIGFLQTGVYKDTTGVALKNTSPTNENKEYKTNKNMMKNKIRITENELKQIVSESVKKVLKEGSYDKNGNFDAESHNSDLRDKFVSVVETLTQSMEYAINELSYIQTSTTDENVSNKARIIINDLLNRGTLAKQVYSSVKAGRLDI